MKSKTVTAGVVLAAATSFVAPSSAQAGQPLEIGRYADSWREDGTYCMDAFDVEVVGHVVVRQGPVERQSCTSMTTTSSPTITSERTDRGGPD